MIGFEQAAANYLTQETSTGPVLQNRLLGADVNLLKFPAPKWHARDGGNYFQSSPEEKQRVIEKWPEIFK